MLGRVGDREVARVRGCAWGCLHGGEGCCAKGCECAVGHGVADARGCVLASAMSRVVRSVRRAMRIEGREAEVKRVRARRGEREWVGGGSSEKVGGREGEQVSVVSSACVRAWKCVN